MEISQISVGLAMLAGLASFLSPCVFSLVPAYVGYPSQAMQRQSPSPSPLPNHHVTCLGN